MTMREIQLRRATRRRDVMTRFCLAAGLAFLVMVGTAGAQQATGGWPTRHIQLIVPYPAGSGTDTAARVFGQKLSDRLGQSVVIENRVGAGGKLGVEQLAKAAPDGYTLGLVTSSTQALAPHLEPKPRYDVLADFAPVGLIGNLPFVLVSSSVNGITSVKELIARAKANPGKLTFGSAGVTTDTYFAGAMFSRMAGIELTHIPYQASAAAIPDLLSGRLDLQFATIAPVMGNIKDKGLRALAVTGTRRVDALPDAPTMIESGLRGLRSRNSGWQSLRRRRRRRRCCRGSMPTSMRHFANPRLRSRSKAFRWTSGRRKPCRS